MVLCCKDSTIFSLSPHLCATDFPDKEHSHDFLLFFRSSSPLSVLTLTASRPAHLTFRPFLLAFVKATAHLLRKTRELFDKTPQLLAKSSLVFRNSRAHLHLIQAKSLVCPPFSHRWPCILAASLRRTTSIHLYQLVSLHLLPPRPTRALPLRTRVYSPAASSPFCPSTKPKPPLSTSTHRKVPTVLRQKAEKQRASPKISTTKNSFRGDFESIPCQNK